MEEYAHVIRAVGMKKKNPGKLAELGRSSPEETYLDHGDT
jgi:hypothetical protein